MKSYATMKDTYVIAWEPNSIAILRAIREVVMKDGYFVNLSSLWGQEASGNGGRVELRSENVSFIKSLGLSLFMSG
jgi:hypothetical protein